jgi:YfiH family protein
MTADCLPLLLCDRAGEVVGAVHAGWRGLAEGVIEAAIKAMQSPGEQVMAWLGPAIGQEAFEVGAEVRELFVSHNRAAAAAFRPHPGRSSYLADIGLLARQRLQALGVIHIYGGGMCTYSDRARFFSYRRDGATGRMASLIWKSAH